MVVLGPTYQEQQLSYQLTRINATNYRRSWTGPKAVLDTIAAVEKAFAESIDLRPGPNNGVCTLEALYVNVVSGIEVPEETQELDTRLEQQSIFANKKFQILPAALVQTVRTENENPRASTGTETSHDLAFLEIERVANITDPTGTLTHAATAKTAFDLLQYGSDSYEISYYILTRSRRCSRRYSGFLNLSNANKVWTTAQLVDYVGNPLLFSVPSLTVTAEEADHNISAGWKQTVLRVADDATGARVLLESWTLAKYSMDLYDAYVP